MIEEHLDPTVEAHTHITNLLRTLVTAAAGTAERRAQQRAQHLHDAQRRSDQERRDLEQRARAERQAAELVYRPTYQHTWWARARPEGIADAVTAAATWAASDPRAAHALHHIAGQLHDRYGIDLHDLQGASDPVGVADAVRDRLTGSGTPGVHDPAAAPWDARSAVFDAAGPALGAEILAAEGWKHLYQRLDALHRAGVDVPARLRQAIGARELHTAKDKAVSLAWRLKTPPEADHAAGRRNGTAARQAAYGSPAAATPSEASRSTKAARRFAVNQRRTDTHKDARPGPSAGM